QGVGHVLRGVRQNRREGREEDRRRQRRKGEPAERRGGNHVRSRQNQSGRDRGGTHGKDTVQGGGAKKMMRDHDAVFVSSRSSRYTSSTERRAAIAVREIVSVLPASRVIQLSASRR